jgi:hypothetical protein
MGIIKKKLDNLRPGKEYLVTVRAKNADINVVSEYSDSVRFTVPQDSTIPEVITNLHLLANFEKVMFIFDYSAIADLDRYEYELYDNSSGTGSPVSSGFSASNVFTISVANSTDSVSRAYWGRVRAIDTTGNSGPWTGLVQTDQDTPLITEQYISSLTASKITAGTIGAHTITLNGVNSILKSSNYSAGSTGWMINGNGDAEFATAIIRGTIDIGTSPYKFKVSNIGVVEVGQATSNVYTILNSGFENWNSGNNIPDNWETSPWGAGTVTISRAVSSYDGSYCARVTFAGTDPANYQRFGSSIFSVTGGQTITVVAWVRRGGSAGATMPKIRLGFMSNTTSNNVNFYLFPNYVESTATSLSTSWRAYTLTATVPSGDLYGRVWITVNDGDGASDVIDIDGVYANRGSTSLFIDNDGSINIGAAVGNGSFNISNSGEVTIGTSPSLFKISQTGVVQIGNTSGTRLFIDNDGAINIGTALGSGNFKVSAAGQVDIGSGTDSFHIANNGTVWSGSTALSSTSPFVLNTDGSIDIGGNDSSSLHITASGDVFLGIAKASQASAPLKINSDGTLDVGGNDSSSLHISATGQVYSGVTKGSQATAPFLLTPNTGAIRVGDVTGSKTVAGLSSIIYLNDGMYIGNNTITASTAATGVNWNAAGVINFQLSAGNGFIGRLGASTELEIGATGINTHTHDITSQGTIYGGEFSRNDTVSGALAVYSSANAAAWQNSTRGKLLGVSSASSVRYKTDIKPIEYDKFVKKILSIPVVSFKYKDGVLSDEDQRTGLDIPGFIAEDIYDTLPIACDLNSEGSPENWNYKILIPPMLKLIQDMYEKISDLESKIK